MYRKLKMAWDRRAARRAAERSERDRRRREGNDARVLVVNLLGRYGRDNLLMWDSPGQFYAHLKGYPDADICRLAARLQDGPRFYDFPPEELDDVGKFRPYWSVPPEDRLPALRQNALERAQGAISGDFGLGAVSVASEPPNQPTAAGGRDDGE